MTETAMPHQVNFQSLVEWCPQAFVFADMEGNVLFSNSAANKLYRYEEGELLGKNVDIFNSHLTHNTDEIVRAIKETGSWSGELIQRKKDNTTFYAELSVNLVFEDAQPTGLCSYSRDITDKKEAELKVLEQRELLASASKLSAIGEMAAGIAHELNNPLGIITSKLSLVERLKDKDKLDNTKLFSELNDVKSTCERISKIISGLKALSRDEKLDPKSEIRLIDALESSLSLCSEKFKVHGIEFIQEIEKIDDILVFGRQGQLSQVFINLLNNAFDAVVKQEVRWIKLTARVEMGKVCIEIRDSGKKIDPEVRKRILEPFFTTKEPGKGTGLGLSISMRIIKDHLGHLSLDESDETNFKIEIPIHS